MSTIADGSERALLEVDHVTKRFGATVALDQVSLDIHAGESIAVVGENGAGKSTLVRVIAGLTHPDDGTLRVQGEDVTLAGPAHATELGITIVPQELTLCPAMTVEDNITLGAAPTMGRWVIDRRGRRREALARLDSVGLSPQLAERRVEQLSLVERTLVQITRGIRPHSRLMIVDEPTAPMSQREVDLVLGAIETVRSRGVTVMFISHRLDEVFRVAQRVVVMRDGRLIDSFESRSATNADLIDAMVGGRELAVAEARNVDAGSRLRLEVAGLSAGVLRDVDISVRAGEIVGVYGSLGSGREDLGSALVGALPRSAGSVRVNGRAASFGPRSMINAGVGYVPSERRSMGLMLDHSVEMNIVLGILDSLRKHGTLDRSRSRAVASHWVDRLSIRTRSIDATVSTLSGGSQQKVLLARWLAAEKDVLILEEPTRGVDVGTKAEIHGLLREVSNDGASVLVSSSDLEEVVDVSDRVLVLSDGTVVADLVRPSAADVAQAALGSRARKSGGTDA